MVQLGKYNDMAVLRRVDFGVYMDGGDGLEILMPGRYVPEGTQVGDVVRCLVYQDSEARLIATTEEALATVGQCALLRCTMVTPVGAFCDWGTSKELLVPYGEQAVAMQEGRSYIVYIYIDRVSHRIVGTTHVGRMLDNTPPPFRRGQQVEALAWRPTPMGWKFIIDHTHTAIVYESQIFRDVQVGDRMKAWVARVRDDDKIDLLLQPIGYASAHEANEERLMRALRLTGGFLPLTDHSDPNLIAAQLHMSKRSFKQAVGGLYKKGRLDLVDGGIALREGK